MMLAIVNPTSGGGAGARMPAQVRAHLGGGPVPVDVRLTERAGHAIEIARTASLQGIDAVIAVGGDGTVHEVANGLLRARETEPGLSTVMGIVPVGTGNDFVKMLTGTTAGDEAWDTIRDRTVAEVDVGYATWDGGSEYFVNAAGTGIDVEVVRVLGVHRGTRGPMDYVIALVRALRRYTPIPLTIWTEGGTIDQRVMIAAVGNGRCVGGTFRICPDARVDDGLFDVCAVRAMGLARSVRTAARILRGRHTGMHGVDNLRAETVELTVPEGTPLFFQLDGELREPSQAHTVRLEMRHRALRVYARGLVGSR